MAERSLKTGDCPHKDAPKRTGDTRQDTCAKCYKKTFGGKILPTKANKKEINIACACVKRPPLLIKHPKKQSDKPLHKSAGMINHFLDNIRAKTQEWESDGSFMLGMRDTEKEVKKILDQMDILVPKGRNR